MKYCKILEKELYQIIITKKTFTAQIKNKIKIQKYSPKETNLQIILKYKKTHYKAKIKINI
jgi:hypothetical protein